MNRKSILTINTILVLLISFIPFLLYIHVFIPDELVDYDTVLGTIKGGAFNSAQVYVYMLCSKLVPLLLLIFLFISNKHWWSYAILIPIATYLFQFLSVLLNTESTIVDEVEFIYVLPIMVIVLVPLFFIRKNLQTYIAALDLKKEMDEVIATSENKQLD